MTSKQDTQTQEVQSCPSLDNSLLVREAAELVNRSVASVHQQIKAGHIKARFIPAKTKKNWGNGQWLVDKITLLARYAELGGSDDV